MTINIQTSEDDQRQLELKVEVSEDRVEQAMRQRARQLAGQVRIPGFRRGKVPYNVVVQRFGSDLIRAEAVEEMVQGVYEEAIAEAGVSPYGRPILDDMEIEPLVMVFTIPLEPEITLGEYRSIRKEVAEINITEEAVDKALEQVRTRHQEIETVDRPAENGDVITIGGRGELVPQIKEEEEASEEESADTEAQEVPESETLFDEESMDLLMDEELIFPGTDFIEQLVGKSAGDEAAFSITFPEEFEEESLAGRTADFKINVLDVKKRDLPELDDELAKLEGDFETLEELRASLRDRLQEEAEQQLKDELIEEMIDHLLEDAQIVYPPAAVEMEIDETFENFRNQIGRSGWDFEDYMKLQGLSEEDLREDFRESSEDRLQRRLAMREFVLNEKLRIEAEDLETMIDKRVGGYDNEDLRNSMRQFYSSGAGFDMLSSEVLSEKVYGRTREILAGTAPSLEELAESENREEEEE